MEPLPMTLSDLESHFTCLKLFLTLYLRQYSTY